LRELGEEKRSEEEERSEGLERRTRAHLLRRAQAGLEKH
jgi:hypothetical protein